MHRDVTLSQHSNEISCHRVKLYDKKVNSAYDVQRKSALSGLVIAVTQATGLEMLSLFRSGEVTLYSSLTPFAKQWSRQ